MIPDKPREKQRPWSQPLADVVGPCLKPALAQFGFDEADLLLFWPDIVGARLAARCEPLKLQWPRGPERPGTPEAATLVVRVEGGFAIELQHQSAVVIERINAHVGWRCVGHIALRQGPLRKAGPPRAAVPPPSAAALARARDRVRAITDEPLRDALTRLGARIADRRDDA